MILGFKQQFPWATKNSQAPTNFREKILYGVGRSIWITPRQIKKYPKIHTMRADPYNRWKAGRKIQMVYRGAGYKIIDHFNKGIPELEVCTGVQLIKIIWFYKNEYVNTQLPLRTITGPHESFLFYPGVWADNHQLKEPEIIQLALNDGFDNVEDFFKWFNKDWSGKIIHWTDYRY